MPNPFEAQPFKIDIAEGELDDLRRRVRQHDHLRYPRSRLYHVNIRGRVGQHHLHFPAVVRVNHAGARPQPPQGH